jgi:cobalt transporter subunit CbtB
MAATLPAPATTPDNVLTHETGVALQASLALLLGSLIIGIAGFSHLSVVHNAAHDVRHSSGFPCH